MQVISRKEAKALGLKKYFTGKPCKRGHITERGATNAACYECARTHARTWAKANPKKHCAAVHAWQKANPEKIRTAAHTYRKANLEKELARSRTYHKTNSEKYLAHKRTRDAHKLHATPIWACKKSIENIYAEAHQLTINTGIKHHVDHIVPLKHPLVCGLHVHNNLRAIPAIENISKSNRFEI